VREGEEVAGGVAAATPLTIVSSDRITAISGRWSVAVTSSPPAPAGHITSPTTSVTAASCPPMTGPTMAASPPITVRVP
jgi:hypothetical protein